MTYNPYQKIKPIRSKRYREFIASVPCLVTGQKAEPHHETFYGNGRGVKVSDLWSLPLSREWHTINPMSRHKHPGGARAFWEMINVDPMLECLKLINTFFSLGGKL